MLARPMKILFAITDLSAESGGVASATACLAESLAARGHQVTIGTVENGGTHLDPHDVRVARFPRDGGARLSKSLQLKQFLWHQIPAHNVVQIQGVWQSPAHQAAAACKHFGIPYVVAPHGMLDEKSLAMGSRHLKRLSWKFVDGPMYQGARAVQCLSAAEQAASPWLAGLPVVQIGNGIDDKVFADMPPRGLFRAKYFQGAAAEGTPIVLFLSRIHPKKGLDRFLPEWPRILAACPAARLVIAGTGSAKDVAGIDQQILRLAIGGTVVKTGQLTGIAKWQAMRDADVFILPSHQEGFSMAITEAMAAGCPVVITKACNFDEVSTVGAGVVVPDNAMEQFADSVIELLKKPTASMGEAGRGFIQANYLWSKITDQMEALYRSMVPADEPEDS